MRDFTFDDIIGHAKKIVGASTAIATDVYPHGVRLSCAKCGHSYSRTKADAARFFSTGWPTHCGVTMGTDALSEGANV